MARFSPVASAWKSTIRSRGRSGAPSSWSRVSKGERRIYIYTVPMMFSTATRTRPRSAIYSPFPGAAAG